MAQLKYFQHILFVLLLVVLLSFLYATFTSTNYLSPDYNIPIAKSILSGEFLHLHTKDPYLYFPGSSHVILSAIIALDQPLTLFGIISWVVLFIVCKKLGKTFGLNDVMSFIFAASFCTTISVIRTIADQSIDKWLCTWFMTSIILLENPKQTLKYALLTGLSLGMLIGSKYSGPLFFLALLPVYWRSLLGLLNPLRLLIFGSSFSLTGLFWYIRNLILTGTPLYPANLPFLKGQSGFTQQDWMLWKIPFIYPQGVLPILNSFLSEYLIWAFAFPVLFWVVWKISRNKQRRRQSLNDKVKRITILTLTTGIACLLLPVTPAYKIELFHIISDMRYLYIFVALAMLGLFMLADTYKKNTEISVIAVINAMFIFSFIPFIPKIFMVCVGIYLLLSFRFPKALEKILA